jgi:signal peptidase I
MNDGWLKQRADELAGLWRSIPGLIRDAAVVYLLYMGFSTVAYAGYHIPSGSMKPELAIGDRVFVSKFAYGYSARSLPGTPGWFGADQDGGRLFAHEPKRGDIAVFWAKEPGTAPDVYIKRIIGLPGDRIQMREGRLYINDTEVARRYIDERSTVEWGHTFLVKEYEETLPGGVRHVVRELGDDYPYDNTVEFTVPANHFFMMGDNRDNSGDSRAPNGFGFIPFGDLIGKAEIGGLSLASCTATSAVKASDCILGMPLKRIGRVLS